MKFHVSHKTNGVHQALFVEANSADVAEMYFREKHPKSEVWGVREATIDDEKPGKPVLVAPEGYGANGKLFHLSYEGVNGPTGVLVFARTKDIAKAYFQAEQPGNTVFWIEPEKHDAARWGARVMVVPHDFTLEFLRNRARSFNEKMAELEKQGFRSGGWDEETDKTAIVKPGRYEHENRIVGYMDRDLNIEWNTVVLSVRFMGNNPYSDVVQGRVFSDGCAVNYDCHLEKDEVRLHNYELYGPMKQMIMDRPLPEIVIEKMDEIVQAVRGAVYDFLQERRYVSLSGKTVNDLLADATQRSSSFEGLGTRYSELGTRDGAIK